MQNKNELRLKEEVQKVRALLSSEQEPNASDSALQVKNDLINAEASKQQPELQPIENVPKLNVDEEAEIPTKEIQKKEGSPKEANESQDLAQVKEYFKENPKIITVLKRLEKGSQSKYNPYWMNSSGKLKDIVGALKEIMDKKSDVDEALKDANSLLSKVINKQRISLFNPETKSRQIIEEKDFSSDPTTHHKGS